MTGEWPSDEVYDALIDPADKDMYLRPDLDTARMVPWGFDNCTTGLRIPIATPEAIRVEIRFAGSDVNPYLAIAATLACGYLGMQEQLEPTREVQGSAHDQPQTLPNSLDRSLGLWEQEPSLTKFLGELFVNGYETFFRVISSWEREHLLLNV